MEFKKNNYVKMLKYSMFYKMFHKVNAGLFYNSDRPKKSSQAAFAAKDIKAKTNNMNLDA